MLLVIPGYYLDNQLVSSICCCMLEITNGITALGVYHPELILFFLPMGGISCVAQTYGMLKETDLSIGTYLLHKGLQTGITGIYLFLILSLFP